MDAPTDADADGHNALAARLRQRIADAGGALTFRDFMQSALYDEQEGYYCRADRVRWGRSGDYRTSAERSELFAATWARYFAALHEQLGAPTQWTICEAGAGAGDFARVVLETLQHMHPRVFAATRYLIDEVSAGSRGIARAKLVAFGERVGFGSLANLRTQCGIVFSNELLDALPVHCVVMRAGALRELCVGVDASGKFIWVERAPSTPRLAAHFTDLRIKLKEGQQAEVNLEAEAWMTQAARAFTEHGYVITIDYGDEARALYDAALRPHGTLRAFRRHRHIDDPLADPGAQDLTATVNWTQLQHAGAAACLRTISLERQDEFLLRAGLLDELELRSSLATDEAVRARLRLDAREMILPSGMSDNFQVLVQGR